MYNGIKVIHVAAMATNRVIGDQGRIPWHIPEDLQHFARITRGGIVVMGRKTFESLPSLLADRIHIVITTQGTELGNRWASRKDVLFFPTVESAMIQATSMAAVNGFGSVYVIGGGEIYTATMHMADQLELTLVDLTPDGDAFYPERLWGDDFKRVGWSELRTSVKKHQYRHLTYLRSPLSELAGRIGALV